MNVTEKEAGKKWCPDSRKFGSVSYEGPGTAPAIAAAGFNRGAKQDCNCIGSGCMSWRWAEPSPCRGFAPYTAEPNRTGDEPEEKRAGLGIPIHFEWSPADPEEKEYTAGWREPSEFADGRRRGYCGRAVVGDLIDALARNAERIAP